MRSYLGSKGVTRGMRRRLTILLLSTSCLVPIAAGAQTVSAGEVSASGAAGLVAGATQAPSQKKIFKSGTTKRVLNRKILDAAGPVGGAAQMLSYAPGVQVSGYGNTGADKYTITLNGVQQGWGGFGGFTGDGAVMITMDGVPMVDPSTDLWQSNFIPQNGLIASATTTYGPGNPADRWYANVAGNVEFTPVQPTTKPGGDITATYGNYGQKNIEFNLRTGSYHGWSTVLAGGMGNGNSFRKAADGFQNPYNDYAIYLKTIKSFSAGSFEFGGYFARSVAYRAPIIPTSPYPGIYITGSTGTVPYSQKTSGYYSTPPFNVYEKQDENRFWMVYARENIRLDSSTTLHNLTYYQNYKRTHSRLHDLFYSFGQNEAMEYNDPHTNAIGDKIWLTTRLPLNKATLGAYYIHDDYNTRNNFYSTAYGTNTTVAGPFFRSGNFSQNDFALFAQDDIHPIRMLHIVPGIRFVSFQTAYNDTALQDFTILPNQGYYAKCALTGGHLQIGNGNSFDSGSICGSHASRNGIEPSISVNAQLLPWLTAYGSYSEAYRTPAVGGAFGLFAKINPSAYGLEQGQYYDAGLKFNVENRGFLHHFLAGIDYFHIRYAKQSLSYAIGGGQSVFATGTSIYDGANLFVDDNPLYNLFVFGNLSLINAKYQSYVTGGTSYNGSHVPYVPAVNFNVGAYYDIPMGGMILQPKLWYQYTGSQYMFDDTTGAPSNVQMPAYGVLNMALKLKVPVRLPYAGRKTVDVSLTALNVTNNRYNQYEIVGAGGYFSPPGATVPTPAVGSNALVYAYPGAPFGIYGTVAVHF